jgi:hypothetical protein
VGEGGEGGEGQWGGGAAGCWLLVVGGAVAWHWRHWLAGTSAWHSVYGLWPIKMPGFRFPPPCLAQNPVIRATHRVPAGAVLCEGLAAALVEVLFGAHHSAAPALAVHDRWCRLANCHPCHQPAAVRTGSLSVAVLSVCLVVTLVGV